jgi:hypothetical protein
VTELTEKKKKKIFVTEPPPQNLLKNISRVFFIFYFIFTLAQKKNQYNLTHGQKLNS